MNRRLLYILLLLIPFSSLAQNDYRQSFDDFSTSTKQKYHDYAEEANRTFAKALRDNWQSFNVSDAKSRKPVNPDADTLIRAVPVDDCQIDITDVPVNYAISKAHTKETNSLDWSLMNNTMTNSPSGTSEVAIEFYGERFRCSVPLKYRMLRLDGQSERAVSRFWSSLSQNGTGAMISSIKRFRDELRLNDWALFEFVGALSSAIFQPGLENEMSLFRVFCMNQLGYKCKVARTDSGLIALFASDQQIYGRKYVTISGDNYYLAEANAALTQLSTYSFDMSGASNALDMNLTRTPKLKGMGESNREFVSTALGCSYTLPVNNARIAFYDNYPQVDVNIYAAAEMDEQFSEALCSQIGARLQDLSGVEALNALLAYLQKDFSYKTDAEQFGREKPFFLEENYHYRYNDCEDRAVLFSYLVRHILGYDCMLLEYSDHVNCAVKVDGEAGGYYIRHGEQKYFICDPTCIGAKVGMSGKNYRIKPDNIWVL